MAFQLFSSFFLFILFVLLPVLSEARFLDRKTDNCFYGMRHRTIPSGGLVAKMISWKTHNVVKGDRVNEHDCRGSFAGCQTYSCIDGNGVQIFVVNSCAPDGGNCTHRDLDPFCAAENGTPKCEICHRGLCNRHKIELLEKQPMAEQKQWAKNSSGDTDEMPSAGAIESDDPTDL